ncbi:calmodulin-like protein [Flammula alnicola]|nr:calmodulin-like protein [Flammula alnicola]
MADAMTSEEELASYRDAFDSFDKDNSGTITASELGTVMRSLGRDPTDAELQDILNEIDKDHNGTIEFNEFVELMGKNPLLPSVDPQDELFQAFSVFDQDSSGKISLSELGKVMGNLGERLTHDELQTMITEADLDGDNEISFAEFMKMITDRSV